MEQMAMEHNEDQIIMIHHANSELYNEEKLVLIHNAVDRNMEDMKSDVISEPELLRSGILWEDHNANLLIKTLPTRVVKTCPNEASQQLITLLKLDEIPSEIDVAWPITTGHI